jgi:hypothetical protein
MSTNKKLRLAIAAKFAEVANGAVYTFLERNLEEVSQSPLPLYRMNRISAHPEDPALTRLLKERFPWISNTDVTVARCGIDTACQGIEVSGMNFLEQVAEELEFLESNLEAIGHLSIGDQNSSVFQQILPKLDPITLNQLEKVVSWDQASETAAKLTAISGAWRGQCVEHKINILENQDGSNQALIPWKLFFISRYFHERIRQEESTKHEALVGFTLALDNREALEQHNLFEQSTWR